MWVATEDLPRSAAHPFYARLNQILEQHDFDRNIEGLCERFYAIDQRYDRHRSPSQRSPSSLACRFDNELERFQVPRQTLPTDKLRSGGRCHECVTEPLTRSRCGDVDFDHDQGGSSSDHG